MNTHDQLVFLKMRDKSHVLVLATLLTRNHANRHGPDLVRSFFQIELSRFLDPVVLVVSVNCCDFLLLGRHNGGGILGRS